MNEEKIFILSNDLSQPGGVSTVCRTLAEGFKEANFETQLLSVALDEADARPGTAEITRLMPTRGGPFGALRQGALRHGQGRRFDRIDRAGRTYASRRLRALIPDQDTSFVISMDVFSSEILAAAELNSTKRISQWHNSFDALASGRDLSRFLATGRKFDHVLMLSDGDWAKLRPLHGPKGGSLRNPSPLANSAHLPPEKEKLVVALGRHSPEKRYSYLLDAWRTSVRRETEEWHLEIRGPGKAAADLRKLASDMSEVTVGSSVANVAPLLEKSAILALPSEFEGLPLVIIEAFSRGVPVVASDCSPGVRELVERSNAGWLVSKSATPTEFGAVLSSAMHNTHELAHKAKMAVEFSRGFTVKEVVGDWLTLFKRL